MCLSLEHQNPSKTSEKWIILIALQFRYTFYRPQTKREIGLLGTSCLAPARRWLAVVDFQNGKQLQVTIIKLTESKENNSIQRLDVSEEGSCPPWPPR